MIRLVLTRLFRMLLTFWVIVTLVFFATRISGNPIDFIAGEGLGAAERELMIRYYKLDQPIWTQYWTYLDSLWRGDFGLSLRERRPVVTMVAERVWPTAQLLFASVLFTTAVALPLGVIAALGRGRASGTIAMTIAFLGYAVPNFVLAVILILVFSYWLNWLPVMGNATAAHFVLPVLVMSGLMIGSLTRFTRNAMLDVLGQDFMRTARAKGLPERQVILRHGLGNAAITILSVIGLQIATTAAAGSVVVETVFAWPGIGELLVNAAIRRDYPVLQFGVLSVALAVIVINALVDLAYGWADPRLRTGHLKRS
ncbi:MAG: ABC transporter permease [Paracoccus sp. (in: a-proteobacteria)]|nr:ABC transporter permease [Paracoccus sp. (in: a-proteobacteria)]